MIEERYIAATHASSLADEVHKITQVDLIKASGMSRRNMASHFLRLISKPTREDLARVYAGLVWVAEQRKIASGAEAVGVTLEWLLDPVCKVCKGAGVVVKKEREHKCPKCKGERQRKETSSRDAQILIDYVATCRADYGGQVFQRLK